MTRQITGTLTFHCDDEFEAWTLVAGEIAGRWRVLGWDVDEIEIKIATEPTE